MLFTRCLKYAENTSGYLQQYRGVHCVVNCLTVESKSYLNWFRLARWVDWISAQNKVRNSARFTETCCVQCINSELIFESCV